MFGSVNRRLALDTNFLVRGSTRDCHHHCRERCTTSSIYTSGEHWRIIMQRPCNTKIRSKLEPTGSSKNSLLVPLILFCKLSSISSLLPRSRHDFHIFLESLADPRLPVMELFEAFRNTGFLSRAKGFRREVVDAWFKAFLCKPTELLMSISVLA